MKGRDEGRGEGRSCNMKDNMKGELMRASDLAFSWQKCSGKSCPCRKSQSFKVITGERVLQRRACHICHQSPALAICALAGLSLTMQGGGKLIVTARNNQMWNSFFGTLCVHKGRAKLLSGISSPHLQLSSVQLGSRGLPLQPEALPQCASAVSKLLPDAKLKSCQLA